MEKVAVLTAIVSVAIFVFGMFAARKTRAIQDAEEERIHVKRKTLVVIRSNDDTETKMAAGGVINSFSAGDNGNVRSSTGDRLAATSGSTR